jgi:hypothetical protein
MGPGTPDEKRSAALMCNLDRLCDRIKAFDASATDASGDKA